MKRDLIGPIQKPLAERRNRRDHALAAQEQAGEGTLMALCGGAVVGLGCMVAVAMVAGMAGAEIGR